MEEPSFYAVCAAPVAMNKMLQCAKFLIIVPLPHCWINLQVLFAEGPALLVGKWVTTKKAKIKRNRD